MLDRSLSMVQTKDHQAAAGVAARDLSKFLMPENLRDLARDLLATIMCPALSATSVDAYLIAPHVASVVGLYGR